MHDVSPCTDERLVEVERNLAPRLRWKSDERGRQERLSAGHRRA
jgi:hypothetical protein